MASQEPLIAKLKKLSATDLTELEHYVDYLIWRQAQARRQNRIDWSFDFVEHFKMANIHPPHNKTGAEIKLMGAECDGVEKVAIYAHPPVSGYSKIEYYVPVPQDIQRLTLHTAIGIRDGAALKNPNLVAFSVQLNDYRVWGTHTNRRVWLAHHISLKPTPGDICKISFLTQALGDHQWTWAVWGEPILVGER